MKNFPTTIAFLIVAALFQTACTTSETPHHQPATIAVADGIVATIADFAPPPSGNNLVLKHAISARQQTRRSNYTGIIKWTAGEIVVSATSDVGRIFTLSLAADGKFTQSAAIVVPAEARQNLQYALWDVQLMFFPPDAVLKKLPPSARIAESRDGDKLVRRLFLGGKAVVAIEFSDAQNPALSQTITLENFVRDYAYTMTLLP